ncbi:MAG TPA: Rieske 2Fe-2S domain-containing protein, partial [Chloroflexota bacterium]
DTPTGQWLRRYWFPIRASEDLDKEPVQPVRLLSEDLTLFKDLRGNVGLVGDRCAHRAVSLAYGIPQDNGLRCCYHGWTYDTEGHVVDMPFEPACLPLKIKSYRVQEMGGLVWAYMGPEPAPLLPRFHGFVKEGLDRQVSFKMLPCNWVQCMDNSMDPVHFEFLHAAYGKYYNEKKGIQQPMNLAHHIKIDFDVFEYGIYKRRLLEGEPEDCDDWTIGHPVLFPYILYVSGYQIRVPVDDTHTLHIVYRFPATPEGQESKPIDIQHLEVEYNSLGLVDAPIVIKQDEMGWIGQGPISDRTIEHLATSDKGIILYHNLILENIAKVEKGEDPMGVIRDPAKNEPYIELGIEGHARQSFALVPGQRV